MIKRTQSVCFLVHAGQVPLMTKCYTDRRDVIHQPPFHLTKFTEMFDSKYKFKRVELFLGAYLTVVILPKKVASIQCNKKTKEVALQTPL